MTSSQEPGLLKEKFSGAMTAIVTPFKNGEVDEEKFRELIEFQIAGGIKAIIPCGTTGESATLTHDEHNRVIEIAIDQVKGRILVIAGTGSNNTVEALKLTKKAKDEGADAALIITPYYNKPTQEGLYQHFKKIAESVDIPIILYNVPGRTGVCIDPATVARLAKITNIIGIKEASGSMKQATDIIGLCGEDFIVLSGEDSLVYPLLCVGGRGVISVTSNVAPRDMSALCDEFFADNHETARKLYYKLLPLCHAMFYETNPGPVKTALAMMGKLESGEMRLPLVPMAEVNRSKLKEVMEKHGLI
ncbi:MAG: 4-hydroxy-tetrahydrodipicolinate synthase [Patescibacteria group bacterium]